MQRPRPIHACLLEDDDLDATIAERMLSEIGVRVQRSKALSPVDALAEGGIDLVVLDIGLGPHDGLDILHRIRAEGDRRPVLVLTGRSDSQTAMKCIRAGADDYVCKADLQPGLLERAVENALLRGEARAREHEQQARIEEISLLRSRLERLETTDPLTNLPNRRVFQDRLDQEILVARRYGTTLVLLWIDIDDLAEINDSIGSGEGDRVLRDLVGLLASVPRKTDFAARIGGDEFAVIACRSSLDGAWRLASRLVNRCGEVRWGVDDRPLQISIGIADYRMASSCEDMIQRAGEALSRAKRSKWPICVDAPGGYDLRGADTSTASGSETYRARIG